MPEYDQCFDASSVALLTESEAPAAHLGCGSVTDVVTTDLSLGEGGGRDGNGCAGVIGDADSGGGTGILEFPNGVDSTYGDQLAAMHRELSVLIEESGADVSMEVRDEFARLLGHLYRKLGSPSSQRLRLAQLDPETYLVVCNYR